MTKKKVKFIPTDPFQKFVVTKLDTIEKDIKFIRTDKNEMEDHLNGKMAGLEHRLTQKIEQVAVRLENKIDPIGRKVDDLEQIQAVGKHSFVVN